MGGHKSSLDIDSGIYVNTERLSTLYIIFIFITFSHLNETIIQKVFRVLFIARTPLLSDSQQVTSAFMLPYDLLHWVSVCPLYTRHYTWFAHVYVLCFNPYLAYPRSFRANWVNYMGANDVAPCVAKIINSFGIIVWYSFFTSFGKNVKTCGIAMDWYDMRNTSPGVNELSQPG